MDDLSRGLIQKVPEHDSSQMIRAIDSHPESSHRLPAIYPLGIVSASFAEAHFDFLQSTRPNRGISLSKSELRSDRDSLDSS